jgi:hypothetical protein
MPSNKKRRKKPFRQLRLGVTENNELTLVKYVKRSTETTVHYEVDPELFGHLPFHGLSEFEVILALRPPFPILRLPEELVLQILTEAIHTPYRRPRGSPCRKIYSVHLSLCVVCKTFRRLVQPLLFSSLYIPLSGRDVSPNRSGDKLCRRLQTDESLARYCRELSIDFQDPWPSDIDVSAATLSRFVNVKRLKIGGVFDDDTVGNSESRNVKPGLWTLIPLILQCMSRINGLRIYNRRGGFSGLPLYPLCTTIGGVHVPNLKYLRIHGLLRTASSSFILPEVIIFPSF